jgi:hypothetical protein
MAYNRVQKFYLAGVAETQVTSSSGATAFKGRLLGVHFLTSGAGVKNIYDRATDGEVATERIWVQGASPAEGFYPAGGPDGVPFDVGLRVILGAAGDAVLVLFSED